MIVMKFGGTSVQDAQAIDRVAAIVRDRLNERPVVVVSALAKITDQLLAMSAFAGAGDRAKALEFSRVARERHYNCACDLLGTHAFEQIAPELEADFNGLDELLRGVVAVGRIATDHRHDCRVWRACVVEDRRCCIFPAQMNRRMQVHRNGCYVRQGRSTV